MKKEWKSFLLLTVGLVCLCILGCRSVLDEFTPSKCDPLTKQYASKANPNYGEKGKFVTLSTAVDMRNDIVVYHRKAQKEFLRAIEDDKDSYEDARGLIEANIEESEQLQDLVVGSEEEPFSILGILAGAGIAFPAGKFMKRKNDYTPEEVDAKLAKEREQTRKEVIQEFGGDVTS